MFEVSRGSSVSKVDLTPIPERKQMLKKVVLFGRRAETSNSVLWVDTKPMLADSTPFWHSFGVVAYHGST